MQISKTNKVSKNIVEKNENQVTIPLTWNNKEKIIYATKEGTNISNDSINAFGLETNKKQRKEKHQIIVNTINGTKIVRLFWICPLKYRWILSFTELFGQSITNSKLLSLYLLNVSGILKKLYLASFL